MKQLKSIYNACCIGAGFDIGIKNRQKEIVYARYCYFHFAKKLTKASLNDIGKVCGGRDHTTVLAGLRKFEQLKGYEDFEKIFRDIEIQIPDINTAGLTKEQKEIHYLYSSISRLEKENSLLKKRLGNSDVEQEIIEMFNLMPKEKLQIFKETRLKPFLIMNG